MWGSGPPGGCALARHRPPGLPPGPGPGGTPSAGPAKLEAGTVRGRTHWLETTSHASAIILTRLNKLTSGKVPVPKEDGAVEPGEHQAHGGDVEKTQQ